MARNQLFKKVDDQDRKDASILVRLTKDDKTQIEHSASIRNLSTNEFIRRAALGRRADVSYQTGIILALREVTRSLRDLHAAVVKSGNLPPEREWLPVILEARAAMLRISK